jgi:hypothetical protein
MPSSTNSSRAISTRPLNSAGLLAEAARQWPAISSACRSANHQGSAETRMSKPPTSRRTGGAADGLSIFTRKEFRRRS